MLQNHVQHLQLLLKLFMHLQGTTNTAELLFNIYSLVMIYLPARLNSYGLAICSITACSCCTYQLVRNMKCLVHIDFDNTLSTDWLLPSAFPHLLKNQDTYTSLLLSRLRLLHERLDC